MCAVSWWCLSVGACLLHLVLIGVDVGIAVVAGGLSLDSAEQPIVRYACDCLLKTHVCHCLSVVSTAAVALASVHHSHYAPQALPQSFLLAAAASALQHAPSWCCAPRPGWWVLTRSACSCSSVVCVWSVHVLSWQHTCMLCEPVVTYMLCEPVWTALYSQLLYPLSALPVCVLPEPSSIEAVCLPGLCVCPGKQYSRGSFNTGTAQQLFKET